MSIYVVYTHDDVSPWYAFLLFIYPIFETVFSIYRRKFLKGTPTTMPDGVHLHTLIYKRLMRWVVGSRAEKNLRRRNSLTSPYLWVLSALGVFPATIFYNNSLVLQIFCLVFIFTYLWLYSKIIHFKSPKWLIVRKK
jgi:UDP-N-acetylmuramyl pentapeptide phosphotransferase/UDP-N-acetylglucosamine-1-phosphate transferase